MNALDVGGRRLHYALSGPEGGPGLALVNSLGTDFRLWDALLPLLPAGWRVLRHDKAGHGLSEAMAGPGAIADHADDLAALIAATGLGPTVLFGVSVGGQIALHLAATRPDLTRGLIAAGAAARIGDAALWDGRIAQVRAEGLGAMADGVLARWFPAAWRAANPATTALLRTMLARQSPEGYAAVCAALREADLTAQAAAVAAPTLVLAGLEDGSTPPALVRGLAAQIPGARLVEIAGAGHLPMVDAPQAVAEAVGAFLARL